MGALLFILRSRTRFVSNHHKCTDAIHLQGFKQVLRRKRMSGLFSHVGLAVPRKTLKTANEINVGTLKSDKITVDVEGCKVQGLFRSLTGAMASANAPGGPWQRRISRQM